MRDHVDNYVNRPSTDTLYNLRDAVQAVLDKPSHLTDEAPLLGVDPIEEPDRFRAHFNTHGVAIASNAVDAPTCDYAAVRLKDMLTNLAGLDLSDPQTWDRLITDPEGTDLLGRGFAEITHDDGLAQVRQSVGMWVAGALIWGRTDILSTFDRYAVKLPGRSGTIPLPLHLDQNPTRQPEFACVQGLVALVDNPERNGVFQVVPGSKHRFSGFEQRGRHYKEYLPLEDEVGDSPLREHTRNVALKRGDAVFWDSRTVHASSRAAASAAAANPVAEGVRIMAMVAYWVENPQAYTDKPHVATPAALALLDSQRVAY